MSKDLIRFVTDECHPPYGHRTGIFASAYDVRRNQKLAPTDHSELCELLAWFKENLAVPDRFTASSRPHGAESGISWIRAVAHDHSKKLRRMAELVQASGVSVHELRTVRPGYILYEDNHQVIALPFSDTPR
jgi:hypothetical protein